MQNVGLARVAANTLVCMLGEVESTSNDIHLLAVLRCQVAIDKSLECFVDEPFFSLFLFGIHGVYLGYIFNVLPATMLLFFSPFHRFRSAMVTR